MKKGQYNYVNTSIRRPAKKSLFDRMIFHLINFVRAIVLLASLPIILYFIALSLKFMVELKLVKVLICGVIIVVYLFIDNVMLWGG